MTDLHGTTTKKEFIAYLIYTWCILAFCMLSFTFFFCITSTSCCNGPVTKMLIPKLQGVCRRPLAYLQPSGTLWEKKSCQNSQNRHQDRTTFNNLVCASLLLVWACFAGCVIMCTSFTWVTDNMAFRVTKLKY